MMIPTAETWRANPEKRVVLFGMSGLGKTFIANTLRDTGAWFHYSVDYRIGTRYMGEYITDNCKREAMKNPFLAELLRTDSIYIGSNITFNNLNPLSAYLGKPGNPDQGGLSFDEYRHRQAQHRKGEIAALLDTAYFIARSHDLYGYPNFICDTGGSICEVVDPWDDTDPVMTALSDAALMIWIEDTRDHRDALIARFDRAPKPMYYEPAFLEALWDEFLGTTDGDVGDVDPDAFIRWSFARALAHRRPRYQAMAENWGITLQADDVARVTSADDFNDLVARALAARRSSFATGR